eukprot:10335731-Heterocapsa_arctica.AAC.1
MASAVAKARSGSPPSTASASESSASEQLLAVAASRCLGCGQGASVGRRIVTRQWRSKRKRGRSCGG